MTIPFKTIKKTPQYKTQKALHEHYKKLYETMVRVAKNNKQKLEQQEGILEACTGELRFANLQKSLLLSELDSIASYTTDGLVKAQIRQVKDRHSLDNLIHARVLFK